MVQQCSRPGRGRPGGSLRGWKGVENLCFIESCLITPICFLIGLFLPKKPLVTLLSAVRVHAVSSNLQLNASEKVCHSSLNLLIPIIWLYIKIKPSPHFNIGLSFKLSHSHQFLMLLMKNKPSSQKSCILL